MGLFKKKKTNQPMYLYTEKEIKKYEEFIEENFGEIKTVLHEIVSPDIHLDVLVVEPTKENNYYKLITMGMGAYKMNVPKQFKKYELEKSELVMYLPPTWNINSAKEEDYWPIRQLKIIARLPIENNTWLGWGHSISNDDNNNPYASNTGFCSMILINALNNKYENLDLKLGKDKINFYQLFPLYQEELEYKLNNGTEALANLFDEEDAFPLININRKNYCKDEE